MLEGGKHAGGTWPTCSTIKWNGCPVSNHADCFFSAMCKI